MKITIIQIGKTDDNNISEIIDEYISRISRYISLNSIIIPDVKRNQNINLQKQAEAIAIKKQIKSDDFIVLLDEKGENFSSKDFANYINKKMVSGLKNLVFIIGGPYGFNNEIYSIAHDKISLSKMTFSHQIVRIIFTEQLYRAFSILNNEPYHHD